MSRKKRILWCGEASYLSTGFATYQHEVMKRLHATGKYELAELASYGDTSDPQDNRWRSVPWTFFPVRPNRDDPKEMETYKHDGLDQFGAWKFEETCLKFRPDIVCVPPGELIATNTGYRPIESIAVGDMVLTHQGRWRPVAATMRRQHTGPLYSIYYNGCKCPLKVTGNHPVLIYKRRRQTNQKKSIGRIYDGLTPEFVPASEVKNGDLIVLKPAADTNASSTEIKVDEHLVNFNKQNGKLSTSLGHQCDHSIPGVIQLDESLGRFVGYLIGDGCVHETSISLTFHQNESRFVEDVFKIIKSIFGLNCQSTLCRDKAAITVRCSSVLLAEFLRSWLGNATTKRLPQETWSSNDEFRRGLLTGLVRSDGCYKKCTVSIETVSKRLANEYRLLCLMIGIPTSLGFRSCAGKSGSYSIEGYGTSALKMHEVTRKHDRVPLVKSTAKRCRRVQFVNGFCVASVRRVRSANYSGQVYNLDVEEDHSYVVQQACVHNCDIRDWWMSEHQERSPFRRHFHWAIMPTVDASPQNEQWLATFTNADAVFTYSDWAKNLLHEATSGRIKVKCSAPPGADLATFRPVKDRAAHRLKWGMRADWFVLGTVMRNQVRKLYPQLIKAFGLFLEKAPEDIAARTVLYLHTSYPDIRGWDLPKLIKEAGIGHRVIFTYVCRACKAAYPLFFQGGRTPCKRCGRHEACLPDTHHGLSREGLADVINCFDAYVQYANSEGFGMPMVEAAACGVPVFATDYSAMSDVVRKLKGYPIAVNDYYREIDTHCHRALPDGRQFVGDLIEFFSQPESVRARQGYETRKGVEEHYTYERTASIWEQHFDSVPVRDWNETWDSPANIHTPATTIPAGLSDEEFVRWGMSQVAGRPDLIDGWTAARMTRDLTWQMSCPSMGGLYVNDMSTLGLERTWYQFDRNLAVQEMLALANVKNHWEMRRTQK